MRIRSRLRCDACTRRGPGPGVDGNVGCTGDRGAERERRRLLERRRRGAIVVGRAPASSAVLGGMVHGAMYDAVAAVEGGLEPFATACDRAAGRFRGRRRRAGCTRRPRRPRAGQAAAVQSPTTRSWRRSRPALRRTPARPSAGRRGRHARDADRRPLRRRRPVRPADARAGCVRADRADAAGRPQARRVRPFTYDSPSDYRPGPPVELTSKRYAEDVVELQANGRTTAARTASRPRPSASSPTDLSSSTAAPCAGWRSLAGSTCASRRGCSAT